MWQPLPANYGGSPLRIRIRARASTPPGPPRPEEAPLEEGRVLGPDMGKGGGREEEARSAFPFPSLSPPPPPPCPPHEHGSYPNYHCRHACSSGIAHAAWGSVPTYMGPDQALFSFTWQFFFFLLFSPLFGGLVGRTDKEVPGPWSGPERARCGPDGWVSALVVPLPWPLRTMAPPE